MKNLVINKRAIIVKSISCFLVFFSFSILLLGQDKSNQPIFLDLKVLDQYHQKFTSSGDKSAKQLENFLKLAQDLLSAKPLSVMDKEVIPPSGNKHDFISMGPYWWPDPSKNDGLPYIRRDGEVNPEYRKITDEAYLSKTIEAVDVLTTAFYITKDKRYADKATELMRVWFLDDQTKMNPNMQHAQYIPGINTGRGIGLIETRGLFKITDAVTLLRLSGKLNDEFYAKIFDWFDKYFEWITKHQYGIDESNEKNNHGTWYDVQKCAIALFLGKTEIAKECIEASKTKRIASQIEADGKQPLELARTKSWGYSLMNLSGLFHLAIIGERIGVDLWKYESENGSSIRKALDFLIPYSIEHANWKYKQIETMKNNSLLPLLKIAQKKFDDEIYNNWLHKIFANNLTEEIIWE